MDLNFIPELKPLYQPFLDRKREIYLVGGAVRDLLLGGQPKDFDFTTDAPPEEVIKMFRRTVPTGIRHGTVTVLLGSRSFEVTTYRMETGYDDHRRPSSVHFTPSLEEDLKRRDFTINGLALSLPEGRLVDFHQGEEDLRSGIIRAIGNPGDRFEEDALRVLRACRFAARLHFSIEEKTWEAIRERAGDIRHLSRERIREELNRTTFCSHPGHGWRLLRTGGLLPFLDLTPPEEAIARNLEDLLEKAPALTGPSRWTLLLFHHSPSPEAWLKKMTFSNLEIKEIRRRLQVLSLVRSGMDEAPVSRILWTWGDRDLQDLSPLLEQAQSLGIISPQEGVQQLCSGLERKASSSEAVFLKELALQGQEVMTLLNRPGGPWLGELLTEVLEVVWMHPEKNDKSVLEGLILEKKSGLQSGEEVRAP